MLSRTASNLYWMARYVERMENAARILDVTYRMSLVPKDARLAGQEWYAPLNITGTLYPFSGRYSQVNPTGVLRFMTLDADNPSSIVSCARAARENARAVRGSITSEMWEVINATWLELQKVTGGELGSERLLALFDWVKERSHLFRGVTVGTALRDEAFHFNRLGTFIERADNTARILDVRYHVLLPSIQDVGGAVDYYQWAAVLRSVSAFESYRKVYRDVISPLKVAELLVLRDDLPRSLHLCMGEACDILQHISGGRPNEAVRLRMDSEAGAEVKNEIVVSFGQVPDRGRFEFSTGDTLTPDPVLVVPETRAGTYYVTVFGGSAEAAAFTLSSEVIPFSILGVDARVVGNAGEATLRVEGARFGADTAFTLVAPGGIVATPERVVLENAGLAFVTFDLAGAPLGAYDLRATRPGGLKVLVEDAIEVRQGDADGGLLLQPRGFPAVLAGAIIPFQIDYENRTGNDIVAPLIVLESRSGVPFGPSAGEVFGDRPVHFLGAALEGAPEVIRPGGVYTTSALFQAVAPDGQRNDIRTRTVSADDRTPVGDWDVIERALRPQGIADTDWDAFWARTQPRIGSTWGDYVGFLQCLSAAVTAEGEFPARDVREMVRRALGPGVNFVPSMIARGSLLDATTGASLAGIAVAAYATGADGRPFQVGIAASGADGSFEIAGLQPGRVFLALQGRNFDLDRDGSADETPPRLDVVAGTDVDADDLAVAPPAPVESATRATAPILEVTADGVAHLAWLQDGRPRYAWSADGNWVDGGVIVDRNVFGLTLVAVDDLFGAGRPGLVAAWQEGTGNAPEIWFALARPRASGGYEWSSAAQLTGDALRDASPTVQSLGGGRVAVVFTRRDAAVKDDTDLYHRIITVTEEDAGFPAPAALVAGGEPASLQPAVADSESVAFGIRKSFEKDLDDLIGLEFKATGEIQGNATRVKCQLSAAVQGSFSLEVKGDSLRATIAGNGNLNAEFKADQVTRGWKFQRATGGFGFSGDFDWRHGLARILGKRGPQGAAAEFAYLRIVSAAERVGVEIEDGIVFGLGIGFNGLEWFRENLFSFQGLGLPDSIAEASFSGRIGPYFQVEIEGVLEARIEGTINVSADLLPSVQLKSLLGTLSFNAVLGGWFVLNRSYSFGYVAPQDAQTAAADAQSFDLVFDPTVRLGSTAVHGAGAVEAGVGADILQDSSPVLMRRPDGTLLMLWNKALDPVGGVAGSRLLSATFDGSTWSAPQEILGGRGFLSGASIVTDAQGRDVAVWTQADGSGLGASTTYEQFQAATGATDVWYPVRENGRWSTATRLATTTGTDGSAELALDGSGRPVVAWVERGGSSARILSATLSAVGWSAPLLVAQGAGIGGLDLAGPGGELSLAWSEDTDVAGAGSALRTSTWTGLGWTAATSLVPAPVPVAPASTASTDAPLEPGLVSEFFSVESLFNVPDDCFKCSTDELARLQSVAAGSNGSISVDPDTCQLVYQPVSVVPRDPNDIIGPEGFGEKRWIRAADRHDYTIRFENASDTSAPASRVEIVQVLDADLDPRSFRVDDLGFDDVRVDLPGNRPFYSGRIDLRETRGIFVDVSATVDVTSGTVTWVFQTIDPETGQQPIDPFRGFLRPNDETGRGEGFVSYSVRARRTADTGTRVDAEAKIVFDSEAPIVTPPIFNTLDAGAPSTALVAEATDDPSTWRLRWDGRDDDGSALRDFTVYVSTDGGDFEAVLLDTEALETTFNGEAGRQYAFYSLGRDNAGNVEGAPAVPDASFSVTGSARIEGVVFEDMDGDGSRDAGEVGIAGFTAWIDADDDGVLDEGERRAQSGPDGFAFAGLGGGQYVLRLQALEGFVTTAPPSARQVVQLVNGQVVSDLAFGVAGLGSIAGLKYEDLDGDGSRDPGEPGLQGWTIFLDDDRDGLLDAGERSTITGEDGSYRFEGLRPGSYVVAEVQQAGWVQTSPAPAAGVVDITTRDSGVLLMSAGCPCGASWAGGASTSSAFPSSLDPAVQSIQSALALTGVTGARADSRFAGLDGRGVSTVVIDTGIDLDHPFFGPDADGNGVADRIVFQYDFADRDADASDRNGHGSHIASLVAGGDARYPGVAPGADIIALKVFGDRGQGTFGDLERALQWVLSNADAFDVGVVNLSLGDGGNWDEAVPRYGIGDELAALAARGIIVVAAAGNGYYGNQDMGLAYPAADPAVISVGATWAGDFGGPWRVAGGATDFTTGADRITAYSQRDPRLLDVFAPGSRFNGADASGGVRTMQGTSQAAAYVSGLATLAQQLAREHLGRSLTTAEFAALLAATSDRIVDGDDEDDNVVNTGATYRRVDFATLAEAVLELPPGDGGGDAGGGSSGGSGGSGSTPQPAAQAAPGVHLVDLPSRGAVEGLEFGNRRANTDPFIDAVDTLQVREGAPLEFAFTVNDPDAGETFSWELVAGPEGASIDAGGVFRWTAPRPAPEAPVVVDVKVTDRAGASDVERFEIAVEAVRLRLSGIEGTSDGVALRFNQRFDASQLALYGSAPPDLEVRSASGALLRGSAVLDADGAGLRWMRTGQGLLPAGNYSVTLSTGPGGFADDVGRALAGGVSGLPPSASAAGSMTWTVAAGAPAGAAVLGLADFMRGPGQPVVVPPGSTGPLHLPLRLSGAAGARSVQFELRHEPGLLQIDAVELPAALQGRAQVTVSALAGGRGSLVSVQFDQALASNAPQVLVDVRARVPEAAASAYGRTAVLAVGAIRLVDASGNRMSAVSDDALQVVGYLADAAGGGDYRSDDIAALQALVTRGGPLGGLSSWPLVDPLLVADVTRDGRLNALDVLRLQQHVEGLASDTDALLPRPEFPPLPPSAAPTLAGAGAGEPGAGIRIEAPARATPGGVFRVTVVADSLEGFSSTLLRLGYDPRSLVLERVTRGGLAAGFEWLVVRNEPGVLELDASGLDRVPAGSGSLFEIDFRVRAEARTGGTRIDFQAARLDGGRLLLDAVPAPGADPSDAVITVAAAGRAAPQGSVDWNGRMALATASSGDADEARGRKRAEDWMAAPWAQDLAQRLSGTPAPGAAAEGARAAMPSRGLPGRDLLRALGRAFR